LVQRRKVQGRGAIVIGRTDTPPGFDIRRCMSDLAARVVRYRIRAEECMAIAEQVGDEELRAQYMDMAENYLKLAAGEFGRDAPAREP
jgi:hypothetical protein